MFSVPEDLQLVSRYCSRCSSDRHHTGNSDSSRAAFAPRLELETAGHSWPVEKHPLRIVRNESVPNIFEN